MFTAPTAAGKPTATRARRTALPLLTTHHEHGHQQAQSGLIRISAQPLDQQIAQLSVLRDTIADLRQDAAHPDPETCSTDQVCRYL